LEGANQKGKKLGGKSNAAPTYTIVTVNAGFRGGFASARRADWHETG